MQFVNDRVFIPQWVSRACQLFHSVRSPGDWDVYLPQRSSIDCFNKVQSNPGWAIQEEMRVCDAGLLWVAPMAPSRVLPKCTVYCENTGPHWLPCQPIRSFQVPTHLSPHRQTTERIISPMTLRFCFLEFPVRVSFSLVAASICTPVSLFRWRALCIATPKTNRLRPPRRTFWS